MLTPSIGLCLMPSTIFGALILVLYWNRSAF
jgi:hypothetical protein